MPLKLLGRVVNVTSIKLVKQEENGFNPSKISVLLNAPKAYKLYKVVCLFSNDASEIENNGNITKEPDFDYKYGYNFIYLNPTTKEHTEVVYWQNNDMTPNVSSNNPDEDWGISPEELAVENCVKWYVVKNRNLKEKQHLEVYVDARLEGQ